MVQQAYKVCVIRAIPLQTMHGGGPLKVPLCIQMSLTSFGILGFGPYEIGILGYGSPEIGIFGIPGPPLHTPINIMKDINKAYNTAFNTEYQ